MSSRCSPALWLLAVFLAWPTSAVAAEPTDDPAAIEFFEKQVRPILANRCVECHTTKLDEPKGGLALDLREAAFKGGETGAAIVPRKPQDSLLIDAVNYGDLFQMPPKSKLPAEEIATLTRWVEMGAPWPKDALSSGAAKKGFDLAQRKAAHWCWQPVQSPAPPPVNDTSWVQSPIDQFVLAKLEAKGIKPSGRASKSALMRRAYFDLLGLPPTPEQVAAFTADESPDAFARLVDELLKSPRFGERWGRHWLDLVRYAESRGHEFDYDVPNAWQYRDYVIRALNADVPYDQFVIEHVAGDLLEQPRLHPEEGFNESVLGTGFWHLGEWVHSPVDIRKDECDRFDNMVDVFSKTFLAMTVSCARCHDHKFDAISQKDYYALYGYLQSSEYRQAMFESEPHNRRIAAELAALDNATRAETQQAYRKAMEPVLKQLPEYLLAAGNVIAAGASEEANVLTTQTIAAKLDAKLLGEWVAYLRTASSQKDDLFQPLAALAASPDDAASDALRRLQEQCEQSTKATLAEREAAAAKCQLVVDYSDPAAPWIVDGFAFGNRAIAQGEFALRTDGQLPLLVDVAARGMAKRDLRWQGLSRAPGTQAESGQLSRYESPGQTLRTPTFEVTHNQVAYLVQGAGRAFAAVDSHRLINGPLHGQTLLEWDNAAGARWVIHQLGAYKGHRIHVEFSPRGNDDLRVLEVVCGVPPAIEYDAALGAVAPLAARSQSLADLATAYRETLAASFEEARLVRWRAWLIEHADLLLTPETREAFAAEMKSRSQQYQQASDKLASQIKRQSRTAPAMWDGSGEDDRLLVRGNPASPRDLVPRRFLSAVSGEDAPRYERGSGRLHLAQQLVDPSNPLTARVMANRVWHHLLGRGIVSSTDNFGVLGQTPSHPELLDHLATELRREGWSIKRLIRAIMLSSTYQMSSAPGEADREADPQNLLLHRANIRRLEAESIRDQLLSLSGRLNDKMYGPPVPVHLTPYMQGRGRPGSGPLDGDGRRSIYISVRRNFLSPMMLAFDTPAPFSTMGKRNVSNVPAQALTLMNDPLVVEQAKLWAQRLLAERSLTTTEARVERLYWQAFARAPSAGEVAAAKDFLAVQARAYRLAEDAAATSPQAWSDYCHVLVNVKEFIFIP